MRWIAMVAFLPMAGCGQSKGNEQSEPRDRDLSKGSEAKLAVDKFAFEAFPQWSLAHTDKACPDSLLEVAKHVGKSEDDVVDPWGQPYKMLCGSGKLPAAVKSGVAVLSFGPDAIEGTADDIKSWNH